MPAAPLAHPGVRFPPPLLFVAAALAGVLLHRQWPLPILDGGRTTATLVLGWVLVADGLALIAWGITTFVRAQTKVFPNQPASRIVDNGPFRFTRNPMYVGFTAAYLGGALLANTFWMPLLLPLVLWALYAFVIRREERYLESAFGVDYDAYRARVRRWL